MFSYRGVVLPYRGVVHEKHGRARGRGRVRFRARATATARARAMHHYSLSMSCCFACDTPWSKAG